MLFNSLTFLIFFLTVFSLYQLPIKWTSKKNILLLSSYLFYASWNPPFVILLWISTVVDWFAARRMARAECPVSRKRFLLLSLGVNLGMLSFFKYGTFLMENFVVLLDTVGVQYLPPDMGIILPVGISFYTFQTLSYTIDVYRRKMEPWTQFTDFALFVSFFPQLVAGPIVRAADFLPQCASPLKPSLRQIGSGFCWLVAGLFQKVVLADGFLAPVANATYDMWREANAFTAIVGTLAFSGQIFFDFAGYSICAIGIAMCFGFILPENFHHPYGAIGFSDFWRRWHISLSSWLRDYLYIPLGGNRKGGQRTRINLMLTMLLGGLWHGAGWRFVVWGGLHGLYLGLERLLVARFGGRAWTRSVGCHILIAMATYLFVCVAWIFFRAESFDAAIHLLQCCLGLESGRGPEALSLSNLHYLAAMGIVFMMVVGQFLMRQIRMQEFMASMPLWLKVPLISGLLLAIVLAPGDRHAFIYFQF